MTMSKQLWSPLSDTATRQLNPMFKQTITLALNGATKIGQICSTPLSRWVVVVVVDVWLWLFTMFQIGELPREPDSLFSRRVFSWLGHNQSNMCKWVKGSKMVVACMCVYEWVSEQVQSCHLFHRKVINMLSQAAHHLLIGFSWLTFQRRKSLALVFEWGSFAKEIHWKFSLPAPQPLRSVFWG